jgi:predicted cupin superfamily sugar epimerase
VERELIVNHEYWMKRLALEPHPEGGAYAEAHRSPRVLSAAALGGDFPGDRRALTSIHFLLRRGEVSHLHRLRGEELWIHLDGTGLRVHVLDGDGHRVLALGRDAGESLQGVVPAGAVFGAEPAPGAGADDFALAACVVAPGFEFDDFGLVGRGEALARWPGSRAVIERLTVAGS